MEWKVIDEDNGRELGHFEDRLNIVVKCVKKMVCEENGVQYWDDMSIRDKRALIDRYFTHCVCNDGVMVVAK